MHWEQSYFGCEIKMNFNSSLKLIPIKTKTCIVKCSNLIYLMLVY